ncbi:PAS domain-containing sensor histidine kinase [Spirosoma rhododendri]|uniref:histidine kinase n=1 Tax=Spirosoma rhododendri TaxID=2728024 RepID=A0A7L5DSU8_9BACT|nr:PAS domain-containing protein [Spirosoma rhododendri]QJD81559.1 PAS domain-containing protein [Spirosoma rhododendri]
MPDPQQPNQLSAHQSSQPNITFALQAAGIGTWDLNILQQEVWWDERCKELYGFDKDDIVPYNQVLSYMHPDDRSRVDAAVQWALNPDSQGHYDIQFRTVGATNGQLRWLHCRGRAFFTTQRVAYRFSGIAQDITELVAVHQQLDASKAQFTDLVMATPTATAVFVGRDMLIQQVNGPMLTIWGKDNSVIGKILHVAMPELEDQPFLAQLQHVFDTGEPFRHDESLTDVLDKGQLKRVWFNHAYNPLYDQHGRIYGVINTATDVTAQVMARRQLEESKVVLQNAVELAELGTWSMDCQTGETQLSERHAAMFGLTTTLMPYEQALIIVHPDDQPRVKAAFLAAQQPDSDGRYQAEYRIINAHTGQQQYIRAVGETSFDEQGHPICITGTTQDISLERESQRLLARQVQERTQELQLVNQDLQRSNDNLQQFAYVASHDLQEPLRKIQSFGSLLVEQDADRLSETGQSYLQRMMSAGARMSILIKDLLAYSRIATRQQTFGLISLETVLEQVLATLDWVIADRKAQIELDALPLISGDESQLSQLFQNLFSNAIKFTPAGQSPRIRVTCFQRERSELPIDATPTSPALHFIQISVSDQGVGFDKKYLARIFQVFQRLHGQNEYPGTGVGLAICQRVVENHGGAITADSQPGQGATFCVYLPATW